MLVFCSGAKKNPRAFTAMLVEPRDEKTAIPKGGCQMQSAADVPTWLGILMFIAGLAITVAMAKWVAHREKKGSEITTKRKA
jgi:hypothetical protein